SVRRISSDSRNRAGAGAVRGGRVRARAHGNERQRRDQRAARVPRHRLMRPLLVLALAFAIPHGASSNAAEPAVVHLDAVASDARGRPVNNLGAGDFQILEDGTARPIESVRFINAEGTVPSGENLAPIRSQDDERTEAAHEGTRLFAIFLDEYHIT